ncbi:MAG: M28 family peptidase [Anaerolineales bacterium]
MKTNHLHHKATNYLETLCHAITERSVGSEGNRQATRFFGEVVSSFGWVTEMSELEAIDWQEQGASLKVADKTFPIQVSPYSLGCDLNARLVNASSVEELQNLEAPGKILLLYGEIAKEQLMPKNFVFYNPKEHQRIISLLEEKQPAAIITATGRNPALAGGVYPFPLLEDGDFDIPSVYMTEEQGQRLLANTGQAVELKSISRRLPAKGYNVIARKRGKTDSRMVITAHIDAKKGTPGAIDNASGVVILLLLAELLKDFEGEQMLEVVALNGEDYYAASGQMLYLQHNQDRFGDIVLNINIDGAGYTQGKTALSFFDLPEELLNKAKATVGKFEGLVEGERWYQGDHSIFIQNGCPAIAVTSQWFLENIANQEITHTPKDNLEIVEPGKLVEVAEALEWFIKSE